MSRTIYGFAVYLLGMITMGAFAGAMEWIGQADAQATAGPARIVMLVTLLFAAVAMAWWIIEKRLAPSAQ